MTDGTKSVLWSCRKACESARLERYSCQGLSTDASELGSDQAFGRDMPSRE